MPHFLETLYEAQKIAFAPCLFKAVSAALQTGLLSGIVHQKVPKTPHEWAEALGLTPYAVDVLADIFASARHAELEAVRDRIDTVAIDWLTDAPLTGTEEANLYWMSQFLDCFSLDEARSILVRTARAMKAGAKLAVLEPLVDEQRHEAAALSLAATSLYFTVMANGNSRFFHGDELRRLFEESGLRIVSETPNLGISHTLFILEKDTL